MTAEEIGNIIHTERIRKGLSCRELAELSDTSAATVCRLETGKRKGSTKAALKILKALGVELETVEEKTTESSVDPNSLYSKIEFAIKASTGTGAYMVGFRNGLRYALYLLDGKEPKYEFVTMEEPDSIDTLDYYKNKLYILDADESKSHLCNSLNAESGSCFRMAAACGKDGLYPMSKKQLEALGYYLERAQAVITYLREEVNRLEEENDNASENM